MKAYSHFTLKERESLQKYLNEGKSKAEIARKLGRHRSNIGREIKRNSNSKNEYMPLTATTKYIRRRKACRRKLRYKSDKLLIRYTQLCLKKYWSPEIIVAKWKIHFPNAKLSPSTIYRALENKLLPNFSGFTHLRRRCKQKYVRKNSATIKPDFTIHERPEVANKRERIGDWEGDTVLGARGKGSVVTMADRKSRYYMAKIIPNHMSKTVQNAVTEMLSKVPVETITLDNGSEFAKHREISESLATKIYFADPKSPWQRGTNENLNDVFRFFYKKGFDFSSLSQEDLDATLELINTRPRKCLNWLSPKELFFSCCT